MNGYILDTNTETQSGGFVRTLGIYGVRKPGLRFECRKAGLRRGQAQHGCAQRKREHGSRTPKGKRYSLESLPQRAGEEPIASCH